MFNKIKFTAIFIIFISGCTNSTVNTENNESQTTEDQTVEEIIISNKTQCFRNEMPYKDNSRMKDIEELILTIQDQKVVGSYNWLPAEKDQRTGNFEGILEGNEINATYTFTQEGKRNTTSIIITLEDNKVMVSGGGKSLGLDATLLKVECLN
jgi:protein involved in sex pheromone biosynthesis